MTQTTKIILTTIALSLLGAGISLAMPTKAGYDGSWASFHIPLALAIIFAEIFIGAAAIFLLNLKAYRQQFTQAYRLIAASISLTALGALQIMLIVAYDVRYENWAMISIGLPFFVSGILSYYAALLLGKTVKYNAPIWGRQPAFLLLAAAGLAIIITPHVAIPVEEPITDTSNLLFLLGGLLNLMAGLIIGRVSKAIGMHYALAMKWLSLAFVLGSGAVIAAVLHDLVNNGNRGAIFVIIEVATITSALVFMKAGYAFAQLRRL